MGYTKVIITRHIQERVRERFPLIYADIKSNVGKNLKDMINNGHVSRSYLNDSKFMDYLWKTYGYDHAYDFVVSGDIVFVIKKNDGKNIAVTCLEKKRTEFISQATKFKKKKKEVKNPVGYHELEDIEDIEVMSIDDLLSNIRK